MLKPGLGHVPQHLLGSGAAWGVPKGAIQVRHHPCLNAVTQWLLHCVLGPSNDPLGPHEAASISVNLHPPPSRMQISPTGPSAHFGPRRILGIVDGQKGVKTSSKWAHFTCLCMQHGPTNRFWTHFLVPKPPISNAFWGFGGSKTGCHGLKTAYHDPFIASSFPLCSIFGRTPYTEFQCSFLLIR